MSKSIYARYLWLGLLLVATGCASTNATKPAAHKTEDVPAARRVEKTEEPSVKKPEPPAVRKAEQELNLGIRNYEEGNYKNAAGNFQNALNARLVSSSDELLAHKYLAFIYCVSGEKMACRGEFKKVLKLNPKFDLTPAEAGHPLWGPVFSSVKQQESGRKSRKK